MSIRNLFESKFKDQAIEKYEVTIRKGYKELIVKVDLPGSTGRFTMNSEAIRKIQDTFEVNLKTYFWSKKSLMISSLEKAIKADEVEVDRIK